MFTELPYWVQKERIADFHRTSERDRLANEVERNQEPRAIERWYTRYLFPLFFAIGLSITKKCRGLYSKAMGQSISTT